MKVIDVDVFESVLGFADADVCEEYPGGYCEFGFSRERIREILRNIPDYRSPCEVECDEKSLESDHTICGATNLPCIKCNPGGCDHRRDVSIDG